MKKNIDHILEEKLFYFVEEKLQKCLVLLHPKYRPIENNN